MRPIYLIGYMGCGKTTLGRAVARATSLRLIDLDDYICLRAGMDVPAIFATLGEEAFRDMERRALEEVSRMDNVIIACGGGTPCRDGMMELMNSSGTTVWLHTSTDVLHRRLTEGAASRPLIAAIPSASALMDFIITNLADRTPYYSRAKFRFDSTHLESEAEIKASVTRFISQFLNDGPTF